MLSASVCLVGFIARRSHEVLKVPVKVLFIYF